MSKLLAMEKLLMWVIKAVRDLQAEVDTCYKEMLHIDKEIKAMMEQMVMDHLEMTAHMYASLEQALAEDKICGVSEALKKGERKILLSIGRCVTLVDNALLATGVKNRVGSVAILAQASS